MSSQVYPHKKYSLKKVINDLKYSLVTTCRNESSSFKEWKTDILNQTRIPDEICIVDACSTDGTTELLLQWTKENPNIRIKIEKCNPARGRNLAIKMAGGDVVVSTDMGCKLDNHWFEEMCKPFEMDQTVQVVAGNYGPDLNTIRTDAAWAAFFLADGYNPKLGPGFLPSNRSVAYTRKAWDYLGGLPEDLTFAADDAVMGVLLNKSNLNIRYAEKAFVYWKRYDYAKDYWKEQYRYGFGNGEANIFKNKIINLVLKGLPSIIIYPYAFVKSIQEAPQAIIRSWLKRKFKSCLMIIPLLIGNKINYSKGFVKGYANGLHQCVLCRSRIRGQIN